MNWLHPLLLGVGAAAVAVPVLLHLIHRKRGARVPFAAVRFLYDTDLPTARHLRLRDKLLLLLRVLAVFALAVWLARPYRELPMSASQLGEGPASLVLVVDNSFSLLYREGAEPRFEKARRAARVLVESLREGDRAAVLGTVPRSDQVDHLIGDREELLRAIADLDIEYGRSDPVRSVHRALELLQPEVETDRRIYIFTDMQRAAWSAMTEVPDSLRVPLIVVDVTGGQESTNHALSAARPVENLSYRSASQSIEIDVARYGSDEKSIEIPVALYDGTELLSQGIASPPANGTERKTLSYDGARALSAGGVVKTETDALAADDERFLILRSTPPVQVLTIDGDPRPTEYESETFFLRNALNPERRAGSRVQSQTVHPHTFKDVSLEGVQVVILANVAAADLGPAGWERLHAFVEEGGGLFLSLGDRIDTDEYNRVALSLLPAPLRLALDVSSRSFSQQAGQLHASRITKVDFTHPGLRIFARSEQVDFSRAAFREYVLTEPSPAREARGLAYFGNGAPALIERPVGKGRVILWTSALDTGWGDFCIKPVFLPLMHQLLYYLAGALKDVSEQSYIVGESVPLRPPAGATKALVEGPGNVAVDLAVPPEAPDLPVSFEGTRLPGIYRVRWQAGADDAPAPSSEDFWFVVNLPPEESDLRPLDAKELESLTHLDVLDVGADAPAGEGSLRGLFARHRRAEYWEAAATSLVILLLLEALIGVVFTRKRTQR